jgi:hypothetical protein
MRYEIYMSRSEYGTQETMLVTHSKIWFEIAWFILSRFFDSAFYWSRYWKSYLKTDGPRGSE